MDFDFDFDRHERKEKVRRVLFLVIKWAVAIAITLFAAKMTVNYAVEITNMVGESMEATLANGDVILINKISYIRNQPQRFDIVVYKQVGTRHSYYSIKRVIGLPGDTVRISEGEVYINGELLDEVAVVEPMFLEGLAVKDIILDEDEYFVLGDNRNNSEDSRFANVGNITSDEIVGKAWLRINKFGIIDKINLKENM